MRSLKTAVVLLPLFSLSGISQVQPRAAIKGIVAREDGKPVPHAFVLVRDYQEASEDYITDKWDTRTEADGSFSLVLEQRCYDIFVSANAQLLPFSERVCFQVERSPILKIKLKADPHPRML